MRIAVFLLVTLPLLASAIPAVAQEGSRDGDRSLTRITRDFDRDGRVDTLAVVMLSGRRYRDTTAWCGAGEKYEGEFAVEVRTGDGDATRKHLNGFRFFRAGEWRPRFADYNGDGRADFNLGQYGSCNGSRYRLYTVERSGQIRRLPLTDAASDWLPVSDHANSTDGIVPVEDGFRHCYYDNRTSHTIRRYRWDEEASRFVLAERRRTDACPESRTGASERTAKPPDGLDRSASSTYVSAMPDSPADPDDVATLDGIVQALYEAVSFEPGGEPDWERLATLFHPDGRLIPPHGEGGELRPVLDVAEFARLSAAYAAESGLRDRGFHERELGRKSERFGDVAHLFSAYESLNTPEDAGPFSRGVNSIQLAWDRGRWWILSVVWDVEGPDSSLPEELIE